MREQCDAVGASLAVAAIPDRRTALQGRSEPNRSRWATWPKFDSSERGLEAGEEGATRISFLDAPYGTRPLSPASRAPFWLVGCTGNGQDG